MRRAVRLYLLSILAALHRLRHDLARELVVGVSSLVLLATFLYVFNDFLNVQVASLSTGMRDVFAQAATAVVLLISVGVAARSLRAELYGERSVRRMAKALGEEAAVVRVYLGARCATLVLIAHGLGWVAVQRWLAHQDIPSLAAIETFMIGASAALSLRRLRLGAGRNALGPKTVVPRASKNNVGALVSWRLMLLRRSRTALLCLALSGAFLVMVALAGASPAPPFVAAAAALAAGYLAAAALAFQGAEDTKESWIERGLGVTHDQFVSAYERLGVGLGLAVGVAAALLFLATRAPQGLTPDTLNAAAKCLAVAALPGLGVPLVLFQIDARRPAVTLLVALIVSLFVGTGILAHWLGLLLIPLLRYYALRTQAGRFYRA